MFVILYSKYLICCIITDDPGSVSNSASNSEKLSIGDVVMRLNQLWCVHKHVYRKSEIRDYVGIGSLLHTYVHRLAV